MRREDLCFCDECCRVDPRRLETRSALIREVAVDLEENYRRLDVVPKSARNMGSKRNRDGREKEV